MCIDTCAPGVHEPMDFLHRLYCCHHRIHQQALAKFSDDAQTVLLISLLSFDMSCTTQNPVDTQHKIQ